MPDHRKLQSGRSNKADSGQEGHNEDHLRFGLLGKSITQLLPIGVVIFDGDLKIIEANAEAAKLIKLDNTIDKSLAAGTDGTAQRYGTGEQN